MQAAYEPLTYINFELIIDIMRVMDMNFFRQRIRIMDLQAIPEIVGTIAIVDDFARTSGESLLEVGGGNLVDGFLTAVPEHCATQVFSIQGVMRQVEKSRRFPTILGMSLRGPDAGEDGDHEVENNAPEGQHDFDLLALAIGRSGRFVKSEDS